MLLVRRYVPLLLASTAIGCAVLLLSGCLKTLDESLMEKQTGQGGGTPGGSGGATGGGSGGATGGGTTGGGSGGATGGTSGGGGSGAGGVAGSGGYVPYDEKKYPITVLTLASPPALIAVDATSVYFSQRDQVDAKVGSVPLGGGSTTNLPVTLERPEVVAAPPGSSFLFVAGGRNTGDSGSTIRLDKLGTSKTEVTVAGSTVGVARGLYAAADGFAYASFATDATHSVALSRFGLGPSVQNATALLTTSDVETGGAVAVSGPCVYWVSNGSIWLMLSGGGQRKPALSTPVSDASGLDVDAVNFYYTRAEGSVWRRALSGAACDGSGPPEQSLASGFSGMGGVVRFRATPFMAWWAQGAGTGGGVFVRALGGGAVTQVAPGDSSPIALAESDTALVFTAASGAIATVPKPP